MPQSMKSKSNLSSSSAQSRRGFLKQSSATLAGAGLAAAIGAPSISRGQGTSDLIKIGMIGCGGRNTGAAQQALTADSNIQLWAMADVFPEQIEKSLKTLQVQQEKTPEKIEVAKSRRFVGLEAYKDLLNSGIDMVLIATPGGFRPIHLRAAVEAGKHIFCEKPMAVDPTGIRSVMESVRIAKEKKLALRAGFNMRFEPQYREAQQRIREGQIGEIKAIYSTRMSSRLARFDGVRKENMGDLEWQLRNWHYFNWLSGDLIMEISVHSVDKIAWTMNDVPPARIVASGARHQQTIGNIWDQFDVTYEYDNGVLAILKTRYQDRCFNEHKDLIIGTKGVCELGWGKAQITGETKWRYTGPKLSSHQVEHDELFADIRSGNLPNDGDRMAKSTLMGIAGRMSAYTGKALTWDEALNSKLDTMPKNLSWDMKLPVDPIPVPGKTKFV